MNALGVVTSVADLLRGISLAAGFSTDAGQNVLELVDDFSEADGVPLIAVLFEGETAAEGGARIGCPHIEMDGELLIVGLVEMSESGPATGPLLMVQDIKNALIRQSLPVTLREQRITLTHIGSTVLPHVAGSATTEVQVRIGAQWHDEIAP